MATAAELAGQIATYDQNKVTSEGAFNEALNQFGIPEIRKSVAGMRTTLANTQNAYNQVDPSVTGRTSGSLVTEAQRSRQVANERAPIAGQISDQSRALGDQTTALNEGTAQATQIANNKVSDYRAGREALQSQYDTTYKSEQDAAAREAARIAAQQDKEERDRNYQLNLRAASSKAAPAPVKVDPAAVKLEVASHVAQGLASSRGKDGYVSNETWAAALNDAVSAGFSTREFFQKYSQFVNPKYKEKYAGWANR